MLTRWSLRNFKSISERKDLELAPVTLVCGANNSGKSTIFQSMLAIAQTFRSTSRARALVLNGQLTRLGSLSDLLHAVADIGDSIQLGFTLQTQSKDSNFPETVDLEVSLISSEKMDRDINHGKIPTIESYQLDVDWRQSGRSTKQSTLGMKYGPHYGWNEFEYTLSEFSGFETDVVLSGDVGPTHANVEGLVPISLLMEYNIACRQASEDFDRLISIITDPEIPTLPSTIASQDLPKHILKLLHMVSLQKGVPFGGMLQNALKNKRIKSWQDIVKVIRIGWGVSLSDQGQAKDLSDWASKMHNVLRDRLLGLRREWIEKIEREDSATSYDRRNIPEHLQIVVNDLQEFWTRRFSYLGPLRDDPKVVYKAPMDIECRSVGSKGEFTAAVLREWGEHKVDYPVPPGTNADYRYPQVQSGSLMKAVITWLEHFGLVEDINTRELSKVGYELTVHTTGMTKSLDLMNVGVGVSQVLPTLVMSLIAPENSTLLFEQPELHLHPRVQSQLGDFFLGISVIGKQCLIETHSEHLINRIRRRIAEAEADKVMQLVQIYFVEKPKTATEIRSVEPNEYGAIPEWPLGFFDESANEAELIIDAANRKRERKQQAIIRNLRGRRRQNQ